MNTLARQCRRYVCLFCFAPPLTALQEENIIYSRFIIVSKMDTGSTGIPSLPLVGTGPNGDFLEVDIMRRTKGTLKVSLDSLSVGCVLRVYNELSDAFVCFKRQLVEKGSADTSLICLHDYIGVAENPSSDEAVKKKLKNSCNCVWILPFHLKGGGGVNISTLKYHVDVHYPKPNVDKGKQFLSFGQKSLTVL